MWQRATDTVDLEIRIEVHMIKILRDFLCFHDKKNTIMPKYISISDKYILFDGCPTPKLGKN